MWAVTLAELKKELYISLPLMNEQWLKKVKEFPSLDAFYSEPLTFLKRRPLELVFNILKLHQGAVPRGHYGDAGPSYAYRLNNLKLEDPTRLADGNWHVLLGSDSGRNGVEDNYFPYVALEEGEFVSGRLQHVDQWTPEMRALLEKNSK